MVKKIKFELVGADRIAKEFNNFAKSGKFGIDNFFNTISQSAINLLRANTPVDTGKLRDSWREISRTNDGSRGILLIGVSEDQEEKLQFITLGTRYNQPNPFVEQSQIIIQQQVNEFLARSLDDAHRWWKESGVTRQMRRSNIGKIPGAGTGTKYNKRRSTGSAALKRPSKGFKTLRRRVGRRSRRTTGL